VIAFDMTNLAFISSAGLRGDLCHREAPAGEGRQIGMSNLRPGVRKVFEIVKALPDMNVFASEKEMDEYLARFQRPEE
jgi:anti-sigma B factor antagonist